MPRDGQLGTAKDGTPVMWNAALGRAVPVTQAQAQKASAASLSGGGGQGVPGLNMSAPGARYLPTHVSPQDQSEAANFNKWRTDQEVGINNARNALVQDREMEGLLARQKTGTPALNTPVLREAMTMFDPELRRMQSLQSEAARAKRTPGEGTISDFDARMFLQQVYGANQPRETNQAIIRANRLRSEAVLQRREFADWYYDKFGSRRGFDEAWNNYARANPIFDPSSEAAGKPLLNTKRQNWRQYYGAVRGPEDERPSEAMADIRRTQAAKPPPRAMAAGYMRFKSTVGLDPKAKPGSPRNPHIMTSAAQLATVPVGDYAIGPDGTYGRMGQ